jgi:type IV pilus assembly protein PilA
MLHKLYKLRHRAADQKGFTLIELLVVILIIGILAAIAIPSFLGQREKANDTKAKSEARTAQTALETFYTDSQVYTGADLDALRVIEPSIPATGVAVTPGTQGYTVVATSTTTGTFTITRTEAGVITRTCGPTARVDKGGCKDGKW